MVNVDLYSAIITKVSNADLKLAESKSEAACAKGTFVMLNREAQKRFLNGKIREILGILKQYATNLILSL